MPYDNQSVAERIMYELLGRRWVWPALSVTDEFEAVTDRIHLTGRPVISIESVTLNGTLVEGWTLKSRSVLQLPKRCPTYIWSSSGWVWTGYGSLQDLFSNSCYMRTVQVAYTYGSPPPEGVQKAIDSLACELDNAVNDPDSCRLPERVTSISRQGFDMTVLDPMDFLKDGKTGLPEVDLIISVFNPTGARKRARIYSADYRPSRRLPTGS